MNSFRVVIVDDESDARRVIVKYLERYFPKATVIAEISSCEDAIVQLPELEFDILFMDVQLGDGTGFDILEHLGKINSSIIFTTAFEHYALKAFSFHAIDYLLKPIEPELFISAVNRSRENKSAVLQNDFNELLQSFGHTERKIAIPTSEGLKFIQLDHIQYFEADSSYCTIYLSNNQSVVVSKPMKYFCDKLENNPLFIRPHKSFMLNISYVSDYIKEDGGMLKLGNGKMIPISRQKKDEVLERMEKFFL